MTIRTLTLTGHKLGTDPAGIRVTMQPCLFYNGNNHYMGQDTQILSQMDTEVEIFVGAVTNDTMGTLCVHDIEVTDVDINAIDTYELRSAILALTSSYLVKVQCTQGRVLIHSVTSPPLNNTDQFPVVADPMWFVETYPMLHKEFDRTAPAPSTREASQDPKYDVSLDGILPETRVQDLDRGPWSHELGAGSLLQFKIMIRNLITFKEPGFIPPMVLWQQLEKPLRGETYGDQ